MSKEIDKEARYYHMHEGRDYPMLLDKGAYWAKKKDFPFRYYKCTAVSCSHTIKVRK